MKIITIIFALIIGSLFINSCSSGTASPVVVSSTPATNTFNYPATATVNVVNTYFGVAVPDPYQ